MFQGIPRLGDGTPLQYSCVENPMDGGAWWAAVRGVAKSWTRLSDFTSLTSALSFLYSPNLTSIHDHRKTHSLD